MFKILTAAVASLVISFGAFAATDPMKPDQCKAEMQKCNGNADCMKEVKAKKGCENVDMM